VAGIAAVTVLLLAIGTIGSRLFTPPHVSGKRWDLRGAGRTAFTRVSDEEALRSGFPLPPSAQFVDAIGQVGNTRAVMAMYKTQSLTAGQVAEFYCTEMVKKGWLEYGPVSNELNRHAEGIMLFFRRKERECLVHIEEDGIGTKWVIMLKAKILGGGER
jgi:hypothetical protein